MKKLVMLAVAAACAGALLGGTQVTEKMLADAIAEVKNTSEGALLDYALDNLNARADNKLYYDAAAGQSYCFVPEVRNGSVTNVKYSLQIEAENSVGAFSGCTVRQSTWASLPAGTLLAGRCVAPPYSATNEYRYADAAGVGFTVKAQWFRQGGYFYNVIADTNSTAQGVVIATGRTDRGAMRVDIVQVSGTETNRAHLVIEPMKLLKGTWERIRGAQMSAGEAAPSNWDGTGDLAERSLTMAIRQLPPLSAKRASAPRLKAASDVSVVSLPVYNAPAAERVDSFEFAENGETEEDYWADPQTQFKPEDWNDIRNWFDWSAGYVEIAVTITQPSGRTFTDRLKIYPDEMLAYWAPPPWKRPTFTEKTKQCEKGHIYVNCKCKYHQVERSHDWLKESEDQCARCQNLNTAEVYDERNEIWVPDDDNEGEQCKYGTGGNYPCTSEDENDHGGWQSHGTDEDFYCQCACGFFAENHKHKYVGDDWTEWSQYDKNGNIDGVNHWANLLCSLCEGQKKWKGEIHEKVKGLPAGQDEYEYTPLNSDEHETNGKCNDCDWEGFIVESHMWKEDPQTDKEMCWCTGCKDYFHHYDPDFYCGEFHLRHCNVCNTYWHEREKDVWEEISQEQADIFHTWAVALEESDTEYDTKHRCLCGAKRQPHRFNADHTRCNLCNWRPSKLYKYHTPFKNTPWDENSKKKYSAPYSISGFGAWKRRSQWGIIDDITAIDPTANPNDPCQVTLTVPTFYSPEWGGQMDWWDWKLGQLEDKFDDSLENYFSWREIGSSFDWLVQWKAVPITFNTRSGRITIQGWSKSIEYTGAVVPSAYKAGDPYESQSDVIYNGVQPQEFDGNWSEN